MKRFAVAIVSGVLVTLALFYLMSVLISGGGDLKKTTNDAAAIQFIRVRPETQAQERKRSKPEKPPEPKKAPPMEKIAVTDTSQKTPQMKMEAPKLNVPLAAVGNGMFGGGGGDRAVSSDRDLVPIIKPQLPYPRKAAMEGIEGSVVVQFDISTTGSVENPQVLESNPPRVFDSAARKFVLGWKYKPRIENGKPVKIEGYVVEVPFKLTE